ncbi:MAG: PQQ-binding-like beta-propeller repeat protein [Planctomycetes bacterium]|nr:PQQ-binding-like beta-propeller repeat protein [Planctomycetota bacterium]
MSRSPVRNSILDRAFALSAFLLITGAVCACPQDTTADQETAQRNWPTWRGPTENGEAFGNPPLKWSETENVRWKVAIPGLGISTPIVWKDRLYLTTAVSTDRGATTSDAPAEEPERGGRGGRGGRRGRPQPPAKVHEFFVIAIDRGDGSTVWQTKVHEVSPHEMGHATGSLASNSPVTDGERIYAHFGSRGLYCLDMQGDVVWKKDLGQMRTRNGFGEGSSPALHGNTLVVNWDHEGDSFVVAFDKTNGDELWRKAREEITSWSTPRILEVGGKAQAIISATTASRGYDLATGDVVWECSGMTTNSIPSPCYADGIVYLMSGFRGFALQAIRLDGAKGDLQGSENLVWVYGSNTSYVPSALLYKGKLWFVRNNTGRLSCLDAKTGKEFYTGQKLAGVTSIYSSPVGAADRVYLTSRDGHTVVIGAGDSYEELAESQVDDEVDASLVIVDDEIFLRGRKSLYCISEKGQRAKGDGGKTGDKKLP